MDEAGRVVQVRDRFHVELIDGRIRAIVEVEFGRPTCVYTETLEVTGDSVGSTKDSDAIISHDRGRLNCLGRCDRAVLGVKDTLEVCRPKARTLESILSLIRERGYYQSRREGVFRQHTAYDQNYLYRGPWTKKRK